MALLSEQRKQILTDKRVELVASIKLHGLWPHLRSHRIVTEQNEARIKFNRNSFEQIGELLDHLAKRTESDFEAFCECLEKDNQGHIVTEILRYSAQSHSNKDFKPITHEFYKEKWQEQWSSEHENKLYCIQPTLGKWAKSSREIRREKIVQERKGN
ncbi:hypothetical protein CAPTEDRAFT_213225 [Capitella teleta]|uniref:CARD domain-containing protein n=1 Tax=Capitella teleta TaxID=283909 RepID=R7UHF9_CAPTE|nr:hypothetical protein CAPTEDRAFT_213225 [Capitella teleta]|eukprot:ELU03248.1 hypothetical protein CAPTEDRAFT_213225 [Capitella teleta]